MGLDDQYREEYYVGKRVTISYEGWEDNIMGNANGKVDETNIDWILDATRYRNGEAVSRNQEYQKSVRKLCVTR